MSSAVISQEHGFHLRPSPAPHHLKDWLTHDDCLFQTIHMGAVHVDPREWRLAVTGMVSRSFSIDLDQLKALPSRTITAFHECYGSPLKPATTTLWRVGNVRWTGVSLWLLMEKAGVSKDASFVWSEGLDSGQFGGVSADRYQKDLPISKALQEDVLVAWEMNGEPLSVRRGGPVRLIVPGWFGTNSTKWLANINVQDKRAPGPFTTTFYNERHPPDDPTCESRPVWEVQPNSMIVQPAPESKLFGPAMVVTGWAWSAVTVVKVDISADDGDHWTPAIVMSRHGFSWQKFVAFLELEAGEHVILARATDFNGKTQPMHVGRNHVHRVSFEVVGPV